MDTKESCFVITRQERCNAIFAEVGFIGCKTILGELISYQQMSIENNSN